MTFEVMGEVEHGSLENFLLAKEEADQQAADTAVAVEKRVDGLELGVGQSDLDQGGKSPGEWRKFPESERAGPTCGAAEGQNRLPKGATAGADPVLGAAQFARGDMAPRTPWSRSAWISLNKPDG